MRERAVPELDEAAPAAPGELRAEEIARLPAHVTALLAPGGGAVFAGTFDAGLHRAAPGGEFTEVAGLVGPARFVNAIALHEGAVWVGTSRGLHRFSLRARPLGCALGGAVEALSPFGSALVAGTARGLFAVGPLGPLRPVGGRDGAALRVTALAEAGGALWAGTPAGLYRIALGTARFVPLFTDDPGEAGWVTALAPCGEGVIAATDDGANAFVSTRGEAREIRFPGAPAASANPGAAACLHGDVFLGTPGGILRISGTQAQLLAALRGEHVSALAKDGDALIAGTGDGRVYRLAAD
jgi:ligand-binding sensor domain-containing protein